MVAELARRATGYCVKMLCMLSLRSSAISKPSVLANSRSCCSSIASEEPTATSNSCMASHRAHKVLETGGGGLFSEAEYGRDGGARRM